jgi:DNA/RNA-binding domain of Phe-tRNA-synthetase-like protein
MEGLAAPVVDVARHPLLEVAVFRTIFPRPLGELPSPPDLLRWFAPDARAPLAAGDDVRAAVRDLLRHAGFRPTGRSKPASEYLRKAVGEAWLSPTSGINAAADAGNAVSLHSGLPVSVVDAACARPPWRIAVAEPGASYVFNPSGQVIDVGRLPCLHDALGPCASPVKDSQRTKTGPATTHTLTVIWGTRALAGRTAEALSWAQRLVAALNATTEVLSLRPIPPGDRSPQVLDPT